MKVKATTKVLVLSDIHVPFHDENALRVAMEFKKDFKPDIVIALGDWLDAEAASTFAKDPSDCDFCEEIEICNELIDRFEPNYFLEGNHEQRLRRPNIAPEFRRLLDPRKLLHLHRRGITWVPYSSHPKHLLRIGKMTFIHGFSAALAAGRKEAAAFGCVVHGHTHRIATVQVPHATNKLTAFNIGCLCDLNPGYMDTKGPNGWAHGFGYGYFYKSGHFTFNTARLIGDKCHLVGKEYQL